MIPKDSTPIKNKILIDILAKGLLSKDEMRIIFYIIRWSWGFDGEVRRQDWTKELTKRQIAEDIGMAEQHIGKNINKMISKNIIIVKDDCYQFNEHYEKWGKLTKSVSFNNDKKLTKKVSKTNQIGYQNSPNLLVKLTKKVSLGIPNNKGKGIKNKDLKGGEHSFKETLKDNKDNKERLRSQIIEYLNKITGAKYKPNTPATVKCINARIKEGFTLENFRYVIEVKWIEWEGKFTKDGKNMEDWMRPITLFSTKFESYLNQAKPDPYQKYYKKEVD